jgi:hypothetical protein
VAGPLAATVAAPIVGAMTAVPAVVVGSAAIVMPAAMVPVVVVAAAMVAVVVVAAVVVPVVAVTMVPRWVVGSMARLACAHAADRDRSRGPEGGDQS